MKLIKNTYIHNHLFFDEIERDILISANKIVSTIRNENIHSSGAEDIYLTEKCDSILMGLSELLNNYSNEYAGE